MDQLPLKTKQRHRSAEEWCELVSAWKQSGKPAELWYREQGVGRESLRRWSKRIWGTDKDASCVEIEAAVPVAVKSTPMQLHGKGCFHR